MIRIMDLNGEIQRLEVERNGLLQRIASLEARNEAMAAVVAAARQIDDTLQAWQALAPTGQERYMEGSITLHRAITTLGPDTGDEDAALDAQAGEVTRG